MGGVSGPANMGGGIAGPKFAKGGKVDLEQEFINADTVHMAEGGWNSPYATKNKKSPTQPMSLPDLDTLALTGKILAKKGKQQLKKELANPSPQMAVDVLGNVGADLLGMPADMIESARGTPMKGYKPFKGVNLESEGTPMLGSENLRGQLEKAGITSGEERPLTENLAMMGLPFAGELKGLPAGLSIKDVSAAAEEAKRAVNFVSSVERTIKGHKMDAMPGNQWSAWMKSNASKAAKKEADATGLHDWLSQQTGKVTKADIEAYVEGNLPKVNVVEKGAPLKLNAEEQQELTDLGSKLANSFIGRGELTEEELNRVMHLENIAEKASPGSLRAQAIDWERKARKAQKDGYSLTANSAFSRSEYLSNRADQLELDPIQYGGSKFEKYTLPGGKNYKETTLALPKREPKQGDMDLSGYFVEEVNEGGTPMYRAVTPNTQGRLYTRRNSAEQDLGVYTDNIRRANADTQNYKVPSYHGYDDEAADVNRLAHLRTNERMTPEQRRVLFLEELQSDWAQKGRDEGFTLSKAEKSRIDEIKKTLDQDKNEGVWTPKTYPNGEVYLEKADPYRTSQGAPIVSMHINELGRPSIFTSEQEASNVASKLNSSNALSAEERLALNKELKSLEGRILTNFPQGPYVTDTKEWTALGLKHALKKAAEEGQDYLAWTTGEQQAKRYDLSKQVDRIEYHPESGDLYAIKTGEPRIAENVKDEKQLSELIGKEAAERLLGKEINPSGFKTIEGEDLQVGGAGMKGYYDQIVPQTMNDVLKQLGVGERVKPVGIQYDGDVGQHLGIELTPELKEILFSEGLPHFHDGGNVQYNPVNLNEEFKKFRYGV
jgi:hypothetical protein